MALRPLTGYAGMASAGFEWTTDPSWDDLQGSIAQGAAGAALTFAAFRDTPFKFASFRNAQNDELHMTYQMTHRWAPGTDLHPHMHVVPLTDPASDEVVRFTGYYVFTGHGQEIPALSGWTAFTKDYTISPGAVNKIRVVALASLTPPAGAVESDFLLVYVKRVGGDAADTYSGDLAALSVDCHLKAQKMGTISEYLGAQP